MKKWLNCEISKGMFTDEHTVTVRSYNGDKTSVFIEKDAVDVVLNRVVVYVHPRDYREVEYGATTVVLPDCDQTIVDVPVSDLD